MGNTASIRFLLGWFVLVIGGFALSSFKLEYYTLPAFPAAAVLVAAFLASLEGAGNSSAPSERASIRDSASRQDRKGGNHERSLCLVRLWTWVAFVGGLLFTAGAAWASWAGLFSPENITRGLAMWATNYRIMLEHGVPIPPVSSHYFSLLLLGGGLMWSAGFAAALVWFRRGRILAATLVVALVGAGLCAMAASVLRQVEPHHSLKPLAQRLDGVLRPADVLIHERGLEKGGGLLFYTGRRVLVLNGFRGDLEFGSRLPGYEAAFIDAAGFQNLWGGGSRVFLVTDLPRAASAISAVSDPSPILVASTGTRWLYSNQAM